MIAIAVVTAMLASCSSSSSAAKLSADAAVAGCRALPQSEAMRLVPGVRAKTITAGSCTWSTSADAEDESGSSVSFAKHSKHELGDVPFRYWGDPSALHTGAGAVQAISSVTAAASVGGRIVVGTYAGKTRFVSVSWTQASNAYLLTTLEPITRDGAAPAQVAAEAGTIASRLQGKLSH